MATIYLLESGNPYIRRRTEKGWTLDFVFNKDGNNWDNGSTFYYWGISGETQENLYADNNINSVNNFHATREFFFSFDADLKRIEWRRKWMKKIASVINFIKIPSPTIGIRSDGKVKLYPVYF